MKDRSHSKYYDEEKSVIAFSLEGKKVAQITFIHLCNAYEGKVSVNGEDIDAIKNALSSIGSTHDPILDYIKGILPFVWSWVVQKSKRFILYPHKYKVDSFEIINPPNSKAYSSPPDPRKWDTYTSEFEEWEKMAKEALSGEANVWENEDF